MSERRRNGFSASRGLATRTAGPVSPTSAVRGGGDERVRPALGRAESHQDVLDGPPRDLQRGQPPGLGPGRDMARHVGVPERPGDLLDDVVDTVGLGAHVGPVRRHDDRQPAVVAGVLHDREADRPDQACDLARARARRRSGGARGRRARRPRRAREPRPGRRASRPPRAARGRSRPAAGRSAVPTVRSPRGRSPARSAPTPPCAGRGAWTCGRSPWARSRPPRGGPRSWSRRSPTRHRP